MASETLRVIALKVFQALKVWQHVVIAPASVASLRPVVKILRCTSVKYTAVDGG